MIKCIRKLSFAAALSLLSWIFGLNSTFAQSSSDILTQFNRLDNCGSVLYLAAHPDDENNRLLAYLVTGLHLRTAYLALNRGEGGQNLIGSEQGDALGLIRSRELLGARSADGALQFFTRAYDFGYSRSAKETLEHWNQDSIISDMVWVIRSFRPDIIIDRFPTTGEGGHGHHTASAILSIEAVKAAADPARFPEQLAFVKTWKVKRLFWNTFNFGGINTQREDQVKLDVGGYDPVSGKGYGEIAAESRSFHKSQGFGTAARRGSQMEYFKQIIGEPAKKDLWEGIDQSWKRISGGEISIGLINEASRKFDPQKPWEILPLLCKAWKSMDMINDPFWKDIKRNELKELILNCQGLWFSAEAQQGDYAAGETIPLTISCIARNPTEVILSSLGFNNTLSTVNKKLIYNELNQNSVSFKIDTSMISQPYWLRKVHDRNSYNISVTGLQRGLPNTINSVFVEINLIVEGCPISFKVPVTSRSVEPAKGEFSVAVRILPPLTLNFNPSHFIWSGEKQIKVQLNLVSYADSLSTKVNFNLPDGIKLQGGIPAVNLKKGEVKKCEFTLLTSEKILEKPESSSLKISAFAKIGDQLCQSAIHEVEYPHTGKLTWFTPAEMDIIPIKIHAPKRQVGYIEGAGDQVPGVLRQLGFMVHLLTDEDLISGDLSHYETIITGVRAYNVRKVLILTNRRLLDFVSKGGNLIVQYNNPNGLQARELGPYPFTLSGERITDETAAVKILKKASVLFHFPNRIDIRDFNGWVQERGLYFVAGHANQYQEILGMKEEGTTELNTAILFTPYGKGNYMYTSLAFFRQLPAGVPGAIRLFVNMICTPGNGK